MHLKSLQRLTMNGRVLLDWDDLVISPLVLPLSGSAQESRGVGRRFTRQIGRQNRTRSVSWTREIEFSSMEERLGYQVTMDNFYELGESSELLIEIKDGSTHRLSPFVLVSLTASEKPLQPMNLIETFEGRAGPSTIVNRAGLGGLGWEDIQTNWEDLQTNWEKPITA